MAFESGQRRVIRISRKKLIIWAIVLLVVIFLAVIVGQLLRSSRSPRMIGIATNDIPIANSVPSESTFGASQKMIRDESMMYPRYYNGQQDITDTREFLKLSYSSNIRTRSVSDTVKSVQSTVRDVGGRVDNYSSSQKSGYISFVVPKTRFEDFRTRIEAITHRKLYTENVSSQNMLGDKQAIEAQTDSATTYLATLESQKKGLDDKHVASISSLKGQLSAIQSQLVGVRQEMSSTDDEAVFQSLVIQEASLAKQELSIKQSIDKENSSYNSMSASYESQIASVKSSVDNLVKQDTKLMSNVETVTGSVYVNWISIWALMVVLSPIHPTIIIIILAIALVYYLFRKGFVPAVEFV